MAFHQNGLTLTYFADEFTEKTSTGLQSMAFNVWNLVLIIVAVYATFAIFQSEKKTGKLTAGVIASAILVYLVYRFNGSANAERSISAPIFQQFNPFYVVALTPVSMAIFGALANKGKEPSAPRKIAYGMLVAAIGFGIMAYGSKDLNSPDEQSTAIAINKAESFPQRILAVQNDTTLSVENKAKALDEIKKEEKFLEDFKNEIDFVLSESNSLTYIEIDD
jgi:POT family proton-dependent oligopeptide transporter